MKSSYKLLKNPYKKMLNDLYIVVAERLKVAEELLQEDIDTALELKQHILRAEGKQVLLSESLILTKRCIEYCLSSKSKLENLISESLRTIFHRDMTFKLLEVYDDDGNLKGLKFAIINKGGYIDDPEESLGTGHLFVASLLFHVKLLVLTGNSERIVVLDEPFAHVNEVAIPDLWKIIEIISRKFDIQFVITTHTAPYGKVYNMELHSIGDEEYTICKELEN